MQRTIGQNLRAARESAGLTLLDAAHHTRIPESRLHQLEEGNYAAFGSMAYARSFLKSYSRFLNVDASEVLECLPAPVLGGPEDYRYLTDTQGPWIEKRERTQRREPLTRSAHSPIPTLVFMLAVFVVAGALLAARLVDMQKAERKAPAPVVNEGKQLNGNGTAKQTQENTDGVQTPAADPASKNAPTGSRPVIPAAKDTFPTTEQETVVRPAVLPSSIPAPNSPSTPVRKPQIVD